MSRFHPIYFSIGLSARARAELSAHIMRVAGNLEYYS